MVSISENEARAILAHEPTPGPWGYVPAQPGYQAKVCAPPLDVDPAASILIAGVGAGRDTPVELINANARLIAAAPDLLAACAMLVQEIDASEYLRDLIRNTHLADRVLGLRAAIAKATGGEA